MTKVRVYVYTGDLEAGNIYDIIMVDEDQLSYSAPIWHKYDKLVGKTVGITEYKDRISFA